MRGSLSLFANLYERRQSLSEFQGPAHGEQAGRENTSRLSKRREQLADYRHRLAYAPLHLSTAVLSSSLHTEKTSTGFYKSRFPLCVNHWCHQTNGPFDGETTAGRFQTVSQPACRN